jgi:hypothetical protein
MPHTEPLTPLLNDVTPLSNDGPRGPRRQSHAAVDASGAAAKPLE